MKLKAADIAKDILEAKEAKKISFGTKQTMELLKSGNLNRVIYAQSLPEHIVVELKHYAKLKEVALDEFLGTNMDLGVVAKRAHSIAMLGFLTEAKE